MDIKKKIQESIEKQLNEKGSVLHSDLIKALKDYGIVDNEIEMIDVHMNEYKDKKIDWETFAKKINAEKMSGNTDVKDLIDKYISKLKMSGVNK
jgi:hypothetical protein